MPLWKRKVEYVSGSCGDGSGNPNAAGYLQVDPDENPKGRNDPADSITITAADRQAGAVVRYKSKDDNLKLTGIQSSQTLTGFTVTGKDGETLPQGGAKVIEIHDNGAAGDYEYYVTGTYDGTDTWTCDPQIHNQR